MLSCQSKNNSCLVTMMSIIFVCLLFGTSFAVYVPGEPGGPWTTEELLIVRSGVLSQSQKSLQRLCHIFSEKMELVTISFFAKKMCKKSRAIYQ